MYFNFSTDVGELKYNNLSTFSNPATGEVYNQNGLEQYTFHMIIGPNKMAVIADLMMAAGFACSQNWYWVGLLALPVIPEAILEWSVFNLYPQLDMPFIEVIVSEDGTISTTQEEIYEPEKADLIIEQYEEEKLPDKADQI